MSLDSKQSAEKPSYYDQKLCDHWLLEENFKPWLSKRFNKQKNQDIAFCDFCCDFVSNFKSGLERHSKTSKHKRCEDLSEQLKQQRKQMESFCDTRMEDLVLFLELRICSFFSEHNLPLSLVDAFIELLRKCFPKDIPLKNMKMSKQKASNIVRFGMIFLFLQFRITYSS